MKQSGMLALLLLTPLGVMAQLPVFTDNFSNGSTTNHASIPGGVPTASYTSYDLASTKAATGGANGPNITPGRLRLSLNSSTGSGFVEAQALFAPAPVSLMTIGDYINLTYTFTNTTGALLAGGASSYLFNGFYNSGGARPVPGLLANSGLNTSSGSPYASGNCAGWQGYVSRISNGGTSEAYTRPVQDPTAGTTSANQDLIGNGLGSGAFNNPNGVTFDVNETTPVALDSGATYTVSYTIALTADSTITVTNNLYSGPDTTGTLVFSQTNTATGTAYLTQAFDGLAIAVRNSGTSLNPTMDISKIAISANIFGAPGPSFFVMGGGAGCPGDAFDVSLAGSVTTNVYLLYTNGVFNGQMQAGTGSAIDFGPQTTPATYTVLASNIVSSFTGLMSGSVDISLLPGPTISTQPSPLVVANNSAGLFAVQVPDNTFHFQWYRNGAALSDGGEFSGTTTSNLLIYPATATDVATSAQGYYCVITNGCGLMVISTTNSLTLDTPANLVWQGGNPNLNWDLNTTPNFTNNAGSAVVFHGGDNVTFDDSSYNTVVTIDGNYVAPGVVTENSYQNYAFTGHGTLIGGGSLVMNGSGTLTVSNANAYTGGTTINHGTVTIQTYNHALGTGPVNLAGGTLEVPITGSSSTGFSNNIVTLADSELQYDQSGTYACVLDGPLTGTAGKTLTIYNYNYNTVTSRLRLYSAFTNNANIALTTGTAEVEMAPYLPSGDQVYNGVISGNGGRFTPRGNGNVIFNAQNTFNDSGSLGQGYSLFMSSGNVGFGADSVSSSPPTIDASPAGTGIIGINVGVEGGNCSFFASGGAHTVGNRIVYTSGTNTVTVTLGGANNLTLSGEFTLSGQDNNGTTNRTLDVTNTALTTLSGVVDDYGFACGLNKTGGGTLALSGVDTYTGPTTVGAGALWINGQIDVGGVTVTNGSLGGTGTILGPVTINAPGQIAPGTTAIGTLTINSDLTLAGNGWFKLNKSLSQSNDMVTVSGTLANTGTGTITVTNLGPALVVGDTFTLFSKPVSSGSTLTVVGGGMNWTNKLAVDGSIQALSVASTIANYPTNITFSLSGSMLTIGWPATHLGWILQSETNALSTGLTTASNLWHDVPGSGAGTQSVMTIDPANPTVFFRLRHP